MEGSGGSLVPCRLFQDRFPYNWFPDHSRADQLTQVRLTGQDPEEFLSSIDSWEALVVLVRQHTAVWLSTEILLSDDWELVEEANDGERTEFDVGNGLTLMVISLLANEESTRNLYRRLIQLMAQQEASSFVGVNGFDDGAGYYGSLTLSSGMLAYFIDMTRHHRQVDLSNSELSEEHCWVLGTDTRPLTLRDCNMENGGRVLFQQIGEGRGPMDLELRTSEVDFQSLYSALRTTTSLEKLKLEVVNFGEPHTDIDFTQLLHAVGENRSLIEFDLSAKIDESVVGAEEWRTGFGYLRNHPTLKRLSIGREDSLTEPESVQTLVDRARDVLNMVKENRVIEYIWLGDELVDETIDKREIQPQLKDNKYRPRMEALAAEETDRLLPLLSGALAYPAINRDPALIWMLLSVLSKDTVLQLSRNASEAVDSKSLENTQASRKKPRHS